MELSVRRVAGLVVAVAALLFLFLPPRPTGFPYSRRSRVVTPAERADSLLREVESEEYSVGAQIWRTTVRAELTRRLAATGVDDRLTIDERVPRALGAHMQRTYAALRPRLGTAVRTPIFLLADSAWGVPSFDAAFADDSIPSAASACVTVFGMHLEGVPRAGRRDTTAYMLRTYRAAVFPRPTGLGLCAFEAAFGKPSPQVREWLTERELRPIAAGYDPFWPKIPTVGRYPDGTLDTVSPYWWDWEALPGLTIERRACAAGRLDHCAAALIPVIPSKSRERATLMSWRGRYLNGFGAFGSPWLMNALARHLGPARFAELWKSDAAPPETFKRLTGAPMDSLLRAVEFGERPHIDVGASVNGVMLLASLLLFAALLGAAMLTNPRKR